jgi:hypothetical protein
MAALPEPYERWIRAILGRPLATESRSTCARCAMRPEAEDLPPEGPFLPAVRCCTYQPSLPPHLVGAILADETAPGRAVLRAHIAARAGVSPLGVGPPPEYGVAYQRVLADPRAFGRAAELACPYLDGDQCGIWAHRGIGCATFHCKFDRGALGAGFWNLIGVMVAIVDRTLRRWLVRRHDLQPDACDALLRDPSADAAAWGGWLGREEEYFLSCARLIGGLEWRDVEVIGGVEIERLAQALRGVVERLEATTAPARVRRGGDVLYRIGRPGTVRLQHVGVPNDLLEVPADVAARLEAVGALEVELGALGLDAALTRALLDWQVLVPVTTP